MFNHLIMPPEDALHGVMARYAADKRDTKIDLGVGVYRDETGAAPIMKAVTIAEQQHIQTQDSKAYLALKGVEQFLQEMTRFVFDGQDTDHMAIIQSVGGTGGIRLAVELATMNRPGTRVFISDPTWPNHFSICHRLGVETVTYPYFDKASSSLLFDEMCSVISTANPGDVLILHGPCHNPTGQDLSKAQMQKLLEIIRERGIIPLIDAAYYGLGYELEEDLEKLRSFMAACPNAMLVMSCSKAFGLYRERTGILFVKTENSKNVHLIQRTLETIGRGNYSMAPAFGAAIVGRILADTDLRLIWRHELDEMQARIKSVRQKLFAAGRGNPILKRVVSESGIFSLLPIDEQQVAHLASEHGIYTPQSGRINLAGFKSGDEELFCHAIRDFSVSDILIAC